MAAIEPPADEQPLVDALRRLDQFDWAVFTSVNGVAAAASKLDELGIRREDLTCLKLAAIGPATAEALMKSFRAPDAVPESFLSEAIADVIPVIQGQRFLLARADKARPELHERLVAAGGIVTSVDAYQLTPLEPDLSSFAEPDVIALTSAAIADAAVRAIRDQGKGEWLARAEFVCIGPITAAKCRELGVDPAAVAEQFTAEGIASAIVELRGGRVGAV